MLNRYDIHQEMMQSQTTFPTKNPWTVDNSEDNFSHLIDQINFHGTLTEQIFHLAGLKPGMRVLDVGCGLGEVSFVAAEIVGPHGEVIGIDKSPEAIALASQRAIETNVPNVQFMQADMNDLALYERFDALIGRLVLMYFADPAVILRRLTRLLKPGGLVVFHELDMTGVTSEPVCKLFELTITRIIQTLTRAGVDVQIGLKLSRIFQEAGLPRPQMIQGASIDSGPDSFTCFQMAQTVQTLLPLMERVGVATGNEVGIDSLEDRLHHEVVSENAVIVAPPFIGAWARKPSLSK